MKTSPYTLVNPTNGNLNFKIVPLLRENIFDHVQRLNFFTSVWVREGEGKLKSDFSEYSFQPNSLLFFSPFQPFVLMPEGELAITLVQFHSDFFCILKHHNEVSCQGILFNNVYEPPYILADEEQVKDFDNLIRKMMREMETPQLAQHESLIAYLKLFLIEASRIKKQQFPETAMADQEKKPILKTLRELIEAHYREEHSPSQYATRLNITPKALAKLVKTHYNKTLTDLIQERLIVEAKRELYLTEKPVKAIASELGFEDEYYFSRFFKNSADISPQTYRETVGHGKGV